MTAIELEAVNLAKAVLKLHGQGFIQAFDEEDDLHCEHIRRTALHHARKIQELTLEMEKKKHD